MMSLEAKLADAVDRLAAARELPEVMQIVRQSARELTGADGVAFVLRDGDLCHYVDEDAIAPLWKGKRFPMSHCVSGWVMNNATPVAIEDVFADARVPQPAYRPTFVKSMAMVPVRDVDPIAAIGAYWATPHLASDTELRVLKVLADASALALARASYPAI
jgi:GAF domain-containing protein